MPKRSQRNDLVVDKWPKPKRLEHQMEVVVVGHGHGVVHANEPILDYTLRRAEALLFYRMPEQRMLEVVVAIDQCDGLFLNVPGIAPHVPGLGRPQKHRKQGRFEGRHAPFEEVAGEKRRKLEKPAVAFGYPAELGIDQWRCREKPVYIPQHLPFLDIGAQSAGQLLDLMA